MAQNNREKDWDDYANSLKQENPHLDPPGYGGDALPSGSSSENVSQGESRFLTKLFQTVLANPVLDASQALKTPQERRAEFEAARRLQNELGLDALEANRRVRAQRDAEYRRTGTESLRRLLEEAYGLDLGSGTPPPVTNNRGTNLRLPGFPDLSAALEAQMLRDLNTSAIAEQNRRFGKKPTQPRPIPTRKNGKLQNGYYSIDGTYLRTDGEYEEKVYVVVEKLPGPPARPTIINGVLKLPPGMKELPQLTHSELLDRIRWIYGEGGGEFAEYYTHTISNGIKTGPNPGFSGKYPNQDAYMKAKMVTIENDKYVYNYRAFKNGTYKGNFYEQTSRFINDPKGLANVSPAIQAITQAIIKEHLGESSDPTGNAFVWIGQFYKINSDNSKNSLIEEQKRQEFSKYLIDPIVKYGNKSGYLHVFYKGNKKP